MINAFISKKWRAIQHTHIQNQNNIRSAILWISKFQRKIWKILAWAMWMDRYNHLYQGGKTFHSTELEVINNEIQREWEIG